MESLNVAAFLDDFRSEAIEHLRVLDAELLNFEREPSNVQIVRRLFVSAHSIKGGAAMVGLDDVRLLAHAMEDVLDELRAGRREIDGTTANLLFGAVDKLRELVDRSTPDNARPDLSTATLVAALRQLPSKVASLLPAATPIGSDAPRARVLLVFESPTVR